MKCKKITIETNGKISGTIVKADGVPIGHAQKIVMIADLDRTNVNLWVKKTLTDKNGHIVVHEGKMVVNTDEVEFE